jgi:tetratricopeptide (TPR) repeat protein
MQRWRFFKPRCVIDSTINRPSPAIFGGGRGYNGVMPPAAKDDFRAVGLRLGLALLVLLGSGVTPLPRQASTALYAAQRAAAAANPGAAAAHYAAAARRLPARPELWLAAAEAALAAERPTRALRYLYQAQRRGDPAVYDLLGAAHWQKRDAAAARQAWETAAVRRGPDAARSRALTAADLALGDYPAAIIQQRALTVLTPQPAAEFFALGLLQLTQDPEGALPALQQAATLDPAFAPRSDRLRRAVTAARISDDPGYRLVAVGRVLADLGRWDLAAEAFRQATLASPEFAEGWAFWSEAQQQTAPSRARAPDTAALREALRLAPDSFAVQLLAALQYRRQNNLAQALATLQTAADLAPDQPIVQIELGSTYALSGDLSAAQAAFEQAIALARRDPSGWRALAEFSARYGVAQRTLGLPAARQAVLLAPNDPRNPAALAEVLVQLGDLHTARQVLLRAVALDPQYAETHFRLGIVAGLLGDSGSRHRELALTAALAGDTPLGREAARLLGTVSP